MNRVGIELSASHCRIVEVVAPRRQATAPGDLRVRAFESIRYDDTASLTRQLQALLAAKKFSRNAWVTLWGVRSAHQFMLLPPASPRDLDALARREARRDLAVLQLQGEETACGVTIGGTRQVPAAGLRREVLLAAASAEDVRKSIQPLIGAGFVIEGVVTPALALTSLSRRRTATPGVSHAYLAINADATGLAIVRDGLLLFAREMPWGYRSDSAGRDAAVDLDKVAGRLASELRRSFLFFKQTFKAEVADVITCGDLPGLRSMTAPLIMTLDLEVETLDSMEGIDVTALPEPVQTFRDEVASLRLAWAVAADVRPPINLLPSGIVADRETQQLRRAIGAGAAAAAVLCALLYWQTDATARGRVRELQRAEQELSVAEPRAHAVSEARNQQSIDQVRLAALDAFDSQGPRLARALEVIAQTTPNEIVLNAVKVQPAGAVWRATIAGAAVTSDPAQAQAAVNAYLRDLQASPYLGAPIRSPSLRMTAGNPRGEPGDARAGSASLPPGMSGIEFSVELEIRK